MRKLYETTVVINGSLEESLIEETLEKIKTTIGSLDCELKSVMDQGRKQLAYPINDITTGYYVHIEFMSDGEAIKEIERQYRLNENIIRYLTVILDKRLLEMRERVLKYGAPSSTNEDNVETTSDEKVKEGSAN
jgi:small subunit ribosomal protein S6